MATGAGVIDKPEAHRLTVAKACLSGRDVWGSGGSVATPYVAVHLNRLQANLDRVTAIARSHRLALRPHIKTHKCLEIARMQLDRDAVGVTASKPQEALVFIEAGVPSVTVAYPVVMPQAAQALLESAARMKCDLRFVVDSLEGVEAITVGASRDRRASIFLEIDVGLERCGVKPGSVAVERIARAIHGSPRLRFCGILSHAGHAYAARGKREIAAIANDERRQMQLVVERLGAQGINVEEVSVGKYIYFGKIIYFNTLRRFVVVLFTKTRLQHSF